MRAEMCERENLQPLSMAACRIRLEFSRPGVGFDAHALRGACLKTYRRMVCPPSRHDWNCSRCPDLAECSYGQVFESRPAEFKLLRANAAIPRPYLFRIDPAVPDEILITLIGTAAVLGPRLLRILEKVGRRGVFPAPRSRPVYFHIGSVTDIPPPGLPSGGAWKNHSLDAWVGPTFPGPRIIIDFVTPTMIKDAGRILRKAEPAAVIRRLRDRLSTLAAAWCGAVPDWDFKRLGEMAENIRVVSEDIHWVEARRRSGHSGFSYPSGGFKGSVTWDIPEVFMLKLLLAGTHLGLGKGTAFGNGRYLVRFLA